MPYGKDMSYVNLLSTDKKTSFFLSHITFFFPLILFCVHRSSFYPIHLANGTYNAQTLHSNGTYYYKESFLTTETCMQRAHFHVTIVDTSGKGDHGRPQLTQLPNLTATSVTAFLQAVFLLHLREMDSLIKVLLC